MRPQTAPAPQVSAVEDVLRTFATVDLPRIQELADLQTRIDRKYIVPPGVFAELLRDQQPVMRMLSIDGRHRFGYESVYFDTPDLASYHSAAYGRRRRFKVRTRSYLDSHDCVLEVKAKGGRGQTVKERFPYHPALSSTITAEARQFILDRLTGVVENIDTLIHTITPTLTTTYDRMTFVNPDNGTRMTADVELICDEHSRMVSVHLAGYVLIESKSPGGSTPIDRWLWGRGYRPLSLSKYCVGLATLTPTLPANKWHQTLAEYFRDLPVSYLGSR
ncbi:VTC domain-containing protein [Klugiella xanthotipulae]|uniref:VTC domain-containing protein n=1 Tax=Klugiella xanthotipulae TaxID=244735 RepID=A0A543I4Y2_9MICO|nr:VTC domain-containing protein [Klugiella xanthotipulae]